MTLFFPDSGPSNNVKIAASNSQIGLTVGDTMTITAGDTFSIGAGSTATIKIGPATSFSLGSAVNISLASTISYTSGYTAAYGSAVTATSTTSTAKATDSYTIQAGVYTPVTQKYVWEGKSQIRLTLLATVLSMSAIAIAVLGSLSSPMFVAVPGAASTDSAQLNSDDGAVLRSALALSITTIVVFCSQWVLTSLLAKSSAFSPVTTMLFNSTGITSTAYTQAAYDANAIVNTTNTATELANIGLAAANQPTTPLLPIVPSVTSIMFASPAPADTPMLTHRVNQAPVAPLYTSPQLSEVILTPSTINLNTTTSNAGVSTHNTQIIMDSTAHQISLLSDSAAVPPSGSIIIGAATNITNPAGNTILTSGTAPSISQVSLQQDTSATLSCSDGVSTGSIVAAPTSVNIGVAPGASALFNATGITLAGTTIAINGTNISIGGALTILGSPAPTNAALTAVTQTAANNALLIQQLNADLILANEKLALLQTTANAAQKEAAFATSLSQSLEAKMMNSTTTKV